jgi:hypothetical protein
MDARVAEVVHAFGREREEAGGLLCILVDEKAFALLCNGRLDWC